MLFYALLEALQNNLLLLFGCQIFAILSADPLLPCRIYLINLADGLSQRYIVILLRLTCEQRLLIRLLFGFRCLALVSSLLTTLRPRYL